MLKVCIIPARGGSKRIPRKNSKPFLGKPIIVYSIQTALESELFDEVMVSTDDAEIAEISVKYGASVPFMRSAKNADDHATTVDVLGEVLQTYHSRGFLFETACCIYPTAPLTQSYRIKQGFEKLISLNADSVFPIVRYSYPIGRALQLTDGRIHMIWPENLNARSQDMPATFHDAGQWYWFNCEKLLASRKLWTENTFGVEVDELEVQDIDSLNDWKMAELKYAYLQGSFSE
jgi:N-acylneuraminate cytidylyltransferase